MKKTLSFMVMAFALLFAQCRKPEVKFPTPSAADEGTTVSMTVTVGPGSKTDITTAGGITWSSGDRLYVGDGTKYVGYLTLVSGQNTPTGTFSGDVTLTDASDGEKTFGFYYLGNAKDYSTELASHNTYVDVSFASQEIYNNGGNLMNASAQHVGYGSANGTVKDGVVTGINVTLVSKVALARFSFTEAAGKGEYSGPLALSGTGICNKMTVSFASSTGFSFTGTEGTIRLRGSHSERYVMLVPAGTDRKTLNFDGGAGTTILENGIEANKFYGKNEAIPVTINAYVDLGLLVKWATCNLGATNGSTKESWYGDYYAWGATETWYSAGGQSGSPTWKDGYNDGYTWAHCPGNGESSSYNATAFNTWRASNLTVDNILKPEVDAAHVVWGGDWRMPTEAEFTDLINNTARTWYAEDNDEFGGVAGYKCVSKVEGHTDKYIFIPAAGYRSATSLTGEAGIGWYWSSTLYTSSPYLNSASQLNSYEYVFELSILSRCYGSPVRPVLPPQN